MFFVLFLSATSRTTVAATTTTITNSYNTCSPLTLAFHIEYTDHVGTVNNNNGRAKALSLEAQAAQLLEVTIQLGLTWFVGLGVGAGANVLLRFACDNPDRVAGLILANGSAEVAGENNGGGGGGGGRWLVNGQA